MQTYVFYNDRLLLRKAGEHRCRIPDESELPKDLADRPLPSHEVLLPNGNTIRTLAIDHEVNEGADWQMTGLRASFDYLPISEYKAAGKAFQILWWDRHSRFCPVCGTPTEQRAPIMKTY